MNSTSSLLLLLITTSLHASFGQNLFCYYRIINPFAYVCDLLIQNPNGYNNFTEIRGTHLPVRWNEDVTTILRATSSISINAPSIICNTFINARDLDLFGIGIERINEDSFRNCRNLRQLELGGNKIVEIEERSFSNNLLLDILSLPGNRLTTLPANIFANQRLLHALILSRNSLTELPNNIFAPLTDLIELNLDFNQLGVVHSHWFGNLPTLSFVHLRENQINSVDERFIDNTGVYWLGMLSNICINQLVMDITATRQQMRTALRVCFENYQDTSGCTPGNLDERVCKLENENAQQQMEIDELKKAVQELLNRNCTST
ncbi:unnamed protein product [Chironomus riparius]|uniref:Uncharacterized protein n=1 Tax=Chironomus riparius TaxID=315576 RepID=A0A9P0IPG4_9DIPT|nr:unnamed protein product [Chironomus riparius]